MDTTTVLEIIKMIDSEINALDRLIEVKSDRFTQNWEAQLRVLLVLKNTIECRLDDYNESQLNGAENQSTEQ
jgi:hypothetical protein